MTDRRQILRVAAASVIAIPAISACDSDLLPLPSQPPPTPDAQQAAEIALVQAYDAAIAATGGRSAETYRRIRDQHAEHVRAMGWEQPLATPTAGAKGSAPSRKQLIREERQAVRRHTEQAQATDDSQQAQILALIAASEAQHVVELGAL